MCARLTEFVPCAAVLADKVTCDAPATHRWVIYFPEASAATGGGFRVGIPLCELHRPFDPDAPPKASGAAILNPRPLKGAKNG